MRLVRSGVYRCTICDDIIFVGSDAPPTATFADTSGANMIERILVVDGVEVHRCIYATAGRLGNGRPAQPSSGLTLFEHRRNRVDRMTDQDSFT